VARHDCRPQSRQTSQNCIWHKRNDPVQISGATAKLLSLQRVAMKEELFDELLESVHEGGAILRGEKSPSRKFTFVSMTNGESVSNGEETRQKMLRSWIITDKRRKNDR
jgi:hypothetical protein